MQIAPVLTEQKQAYFRVKCAEMLLGGMSLDEKVSIGLSVISVLQTFLISRFVTQYAVILIVPAVINFILMAIQQREDLRNSKLIMLLVTAQTVFSASSIYYSQFVLELFVFLLLFPRLQLIEIGFTQSSIYSRSAYAITILIIVLILDNSGVSSLAPRIVYYCIPVAIFFGIIGQYLLTIEYFIEQVNWLMGTTEMYSIQRNILSLLENAITIIIVVGSSYADRRLAIILSGILPLRRLFNICGVVPKEDKQLYQQRYRIKQQLYTDIAFMLTYICVIMIVFVPYFNYEPLLYILFAFICIQGLFYIKGKQFLKYILFIAAILQHILLVDLPFDLDSNFANRVASSITLLRLFNLSHHRLIDLTVQELVMFVVSKISNYSFCDNLIWGFIISVIFRAMQSIPTRLKTLFIANKQMISIKKQRVQNANWIVAIQVGLFPITLSILIISSILDAPYVPFLGLPLFTIGSLRPKRNCDIGRHIQGSSEAGIYNSLVHQVSGMIDITSPRNQLLRLGKYLCVAHILERCESFAVVQFKGLESQETTSCHGVEAREVDRLVVEKDWRSSLTYDRTIKVTSYEEGATTLTGIIEAEEFVQGFKSVYLKLLCYFTPVLPIDLPIAQVQQLAKQFEGSEKFFPESFARKLNLHQLYNQPEIRQQIPQSRTRIKPVDDDDLFGMLDDLQQPEQQQFTSNKTTFDSYRRCILFLYQISLQDMDFNFRQRFNQKQLFELFKSTEWMQARRQMQKMDACFSQLVTMSIRATMKICVDRFSIEGEIKFTDEELIEELKDKSTFVGMGNDIQFQDAMRNHLNLWSLGYDQVKQNVVVYRSGFNQIECQVFKFDTDVIRGIEANLQMELLFFTNDDEERYSIQTHEQFFRNMIIESSELPLGYAPFYSGPIEISLR